MKCIILPIIIKQMSSFLGGVPAEDADWKICQSVFNNRINSADRIEYVIKETELLRCGKTNSKGRIKYLGFLLTISKSRTKTFMMLPFATNHTARLLQMTESDWLQWTVAAMHSLISAVCGQICETTKQKN